MPVGKREVVPSYFSWNRRKYRVTLATVLKFVDEVTPKTMVLVTEWRAKQLSSCRVFYSLPVMLTLYLHNIILYVIVAL